MNYFVSDARANGRKILSWVSVLSGVMALLLMVSGTRLSAQTAGSISGHLNDPVGASLAQTDLTLTNVGTNTSRVTKSTDTGDYTFTEVPPGFYKVEVRHVGFKT